ncbi:hypothetical protein EIP91_011034 [Steccherinum ochraceum]|uniref:Uncharacterized protein n=1 Tax=Steccherinum ochraceum TaxID=92696 RepID=A0A4R0R239_9APHY|nr:hypothetical protein EIP91_011034 [Steccherinum ochraceum]
MAPVFLLTRAFAISSLLVGALTTTAHARPLAAPVEYALGRRFMGACIWGCMFADPVNPAAPSATPSSTVVPVHNAVVPHLIEIIEAASPTPSSTPETETQDESDLPNALLRFPGGSGSSSSTDTDVENATEPVVVIDLDVPAGSQGDDEDASGSVLDDLVAAVPEIVSTGELPHTVLQHIAYPPPSLPSSQPTPPQTDSRHRTSACIRTTPSSSPALPPPNPHAITSLNPISPAPPLLSRAWGMDSPLLPAYTPTLFSVSAPVPVSVSPDFTV